MDEILLRVKTGGMISNDLTTYRPDILRVGRTNSTNHFVREVTLDAIVEFYMSAKAKEALSRLQLEVASLKKKITLAGGSDTEIAAMYEEMHRKQVDIFRYTLVNEGFQVAHGSYTRKEAKNELQKSIVKESHIVFTTLSGSGTQIFTELLENQYFDSIVIGNVQGFGGSSSFR